MKKLIALTLCLILTVLPLTAFADLATPTDAAVETQDVALTATATSVMIGGLYLNASFPYYTNGASGALGERHDTTYTGTWNAHFDAATGTLTFDGLDVRVDAEYANQVVASVGVETGDVTLVLKSGTTNTLVSDYTGRDASQAIDIRGGNLTVRGGGTLNATGVSATVCG